MARRRYYTQCFAVCSFGRKFGCLAARAGSANARPASSGPASAAELPRCRRHGAAQRRGHRQQGQLRHRPQAFRFHHHRRHASARRSPPLAKVFRRPKSVDSLPPPKARRRKLSRTRISKKPRPEEDPWTRWSARTCSSCSTPAITCIAALPSRRMLSPISCARSTGLTASRSTPTAAICSALRC